MRFKAVKIHEKITVSKMNITSDHADSKLTVVFFYLNFLHYSCTLLRIKRLVKI